MSLTFATRPVGRSWTRILGIDDLGALANLGIAAGFTALMAVQIAHHQMWRDETNAWGIVLASPTLTALFHNLHYEGHPGLWHLLLWCASWLSPNPASIKLVQGCIAAGFIFSIAFRSPFSRLEKLLLLLNYFALYEYAVVSRNYGIGMLLALIYVQLRIACPDRLLLNATVLGLLANTNVYATILSAALASEAVIDQLIMRRGAYLATARKLAPAAISYTGLVLLCAVTILPASDISWRTTSRPLQAVLDPLRFLWAAVDYVEFGLVPAARELVDVASPVGLMIVIALLPVIGVGTFRLFRGDWHALLIFGMTVVGATLFGHLIYIGGERHWGITFIAFVVAYWIQRTRRPQPSRFALVLLVLGAVAGVGACIREAEQPYSYASAAADWLKDHGLADAALIGTPDTSAAGVAELLGRQMYFLDCNCADTFLRFQNRRDGYRLGQLPERLATAMAWAGNRPAVLVISSPLSQDQLAEILDRHIKAVQVAGFTGAYMNDEDFYLYKVAE